MLLVILDRIFRKRGRSSSYVIGEQLAQARRIEEARLKDPNVGPSPLPAELHYDRWLGELDLSNPVKQPLDDELSNLCRRFAAGNPHVRAQLRRAASMDDFYTLLSFARRSAVFAMRDRQAEHIIDGLAAIATIEPNRIDFRDALLALSLLHHAGRKIAANPTDLFGKAASLAEPRMSELILGFLMRSEDGRDIQKSWGYTEVETNAGPGFIGWGLESYQPTYPLDQIGLALAELMKRDKYQPTSVTLASALPAVWLASVDDRLLKDALASVRAAVTISGNLRPQAGPDHRHNILIFFLVELGDETNAGSLLQLARNKRTQVTDFVLIGASVERLFCLAVARSFVADEPSFETPTSIQRFSAGISEVLHQA